MNNNGYKNKSIKEMMIFSNGSILNQSWRGGKTVNELYYFRFNSLKRKLRALLLEKLNDVNRVRVLFYGQV